MFFFSVLFFSYNFFSYSYYSSSFYLILPEHMTQYWKCVHVGTLLVTQVPLWCGVLIDMTMCIWDQRINEKSLHLLFNFAMNAKLL